MKIAILSDIHSNKYALKAVLTEIDKLKISKVIILGDFFGYYPWAVDTYQMILKREKIGIKGNHDALISENKNPTPLPSYWPAILDNRKQLKSYCPEALGWLEDLSYQKKIIIENLKFLLFHGTPDDPAEGRFYPDDQNEFPWFSKKNEVLLLGHTHYPLFKQLPTGGVIINPGSVGQPRDGNPYPSWCVFDTKDSSVSWRRTKYNYRHAIKELEKLNWDNRSILALQKTTQGALNL